MPIRMLRFCPTCLSTEHAAVRTQCGACGTMLKPLLDAEGAISGDFLQARGFCCSLGCRNCPYEKCGSDQDKSCEKCGGTFQCRREGCWCESVRLAPATLKWLRRTYADCLCPSCLGELSAAG